MAEAGENPYWDRIVGDDWPTLGPATWYSLEQTARAGAEAVNLGDIRQARLAFDETVRSSVGLAPARAVMVALEQQPWRFAQALALTAEMFGAFAETTRRVRNQILDVVDAAQREIAEIRREDEGEDGSGEETDSEEEAAAEAAAVDQVLDEARADVRDIVTAALRAVSPAGLPMYGQLMDLLVPERREKDGPGGDRGAGGERGRHGGGAGRESGAAQGDSGRAGDAVPVGEGALREQGVDAGDGRAVRPGVGDSVPGADGVEGPVDGPAPVTVLPTPGSPVVPVDLGDSQPTPVGPSAGGAPVEPGGDGMGGAVPGRLHTPVSVGAGSDAGEQEYDADDPGGREYGPDDDLGAADMADADGGFDAHRGEGPSTADIAVDPATASGGFEAGGPPAAVTAPEQGDPLAGQPVPMVFAPNAGGPPTPVGGTVTASGTGVTPPTSGSTSPAAHSIAASASTGTSANSFAGRTGGPNLPAGVTPGAVSANQPDISRPAAPASGGADGRTAHPPDRPAQPRSGDDGDIVRDAVGAALAAAAAPDFILGNEVDDDLVLATTVLGGLLAAVERRAIGIDWAVAVLRHDGGPSVFFTSNEGRGWIPAGVFPPREVSMPWLWSVSAHERWEGLADPARILAEFALAWGAKSGARLTAMASSRAIGPDLRQCAPTVPMAGSVAADPGMDLRVPVPGLVDRLEFTGSDQLIARAVQVPDDGIALRCLELAVDAHMRLRDTGFGGPDLMEAPTLRQRVLKAVRRDGEAPEEWWEELRDADDLLAATATTQRADTGRIRIGELRDPVAEAKSDLVLLAAKTFQRRANELTLLLADTPTRQTLRDAVYAHAQILSHPRYLARGRNPAPPSGRSVIAVPGM